MVPLQMMCIKDISWNLGVSVFKVQDLHYEHLMSAKQTIALCRVL